ncbi:MAG: GlsB/YeaQ/YmgE family stress response membrane protein [Lachnospiraceae bacterium]|nr:GlsB/YeaQ/YmgE family stress response membrane protein [Lachnospiraceae bacterium]
MNIIISLIIGGICGWLAGIIMKTGYGLLFNVILGVIGGVVGGFLLGLIGFGATNIIGAIISGVLGSCVVIAVVRFIKKK